MTNVRNTWTRMLKPLSFSFVVAITTVSCSDEPTLLNTPDPSSFIRGDVVIDSTSVVAVNGSSFKKVLPMGGSQDIVGRWGNYSALTAIRFFQASFPTRDTIQVISATLRLRAISWFGDSTAPLRFSAYRISKTWTPSGVTWDSVQAAGFYEAAPLRGTYDNAISADSEYIYINLDTAMVRGWFASGTRDSNFGVLLVPNLSAQVGRGFTPFNAADSARFYPQLEVIARGVAGGAQDTTRDSTGYSTFVGNIDNLNSNPALLYAQAGVVYRSILQFDVSAIPRGAIIASAELLLDRDPATSRLYKFTRDTIVGLHVLLSQGDSTFEAQGAYGSRKSGTPYTFSFDVRHAVQRWIRDPNYGLILRALSEFNNLDLYTFHGQLAADPALRPRINIKYVIER